MSFNNIFNSASSETAESLDYNSFDNNNLAQQNKMILNTSNKVNDIVLSQDLPFEFQSDQTNYSFNFLAQSLDSPAMDEAKSSLLQGLDPTPFDIEQFFAEDFGEINPPFPETPVPIDEGTKKRKMNPISEEVQILSDKPVSKTIFLSKLKSDHLQKLLNNSLPSLNNETRCYFEALIKDLISISRNEVEVEVKHLRALLETQMIKSTKKNPHLKSAFIAALKASGEKIQRCNKQDRINVKTIKALLKELPSNHINDQIADYINAKILSFYEENDLKSIELSGLKEEDVYKLKSLIDGLKKGQQRKHGVCVSKINEVFFSMLNKSQTK